MERVSLEQLFNEEPNGLWDSIAALAFDRFDGAGVSYALAYPFVEKPDLERVAFRRLAGRLASGIGTYRRAT